MENRTGRFDRKDVFRAGLVEHARFEGTWEMPVIPSSGRIPDALLPFDHALARDRFDSFVHFYIDDERFERIWKRPGDYLARLKKFRPTSASTAICRSGCRSGTPIGAALLGIGWRAAASR